MPTLTIDLPAEVAAGVERLPETERREFRASVEAFAVALARNRRPHPLEYTRAELRAMPKAERAAIMAAQAADAAPLYEADLALPPRERELTAFSALNDYDPIKEPEQYLGASSA